MAWRVELADDEIKQQHCDYVPDIPEARGKTEYVLSKDIIDIIKI